LRVVCLLAAFIVIAYLCKKQYAANRRATRSSVIYLHLRSLDGYRAGIPVYIAKHLSIQPKGFIVIPARSSELRTQRELWSSAASALGRTLLPVIVCTDSLCPLTEGENPASTDEIVVLDLLQYIPAFAVAQAKEKHQILILDSSFIVRQTYPRPEGTENAKAVVKKVKELL
jgi:hypothetical protein